MWSRCGTTAAGLKGLARQTSETAMAEETPGRAPRSLRIWEYQRVGRWDHYRVAELMVVVSEVEGKEGFDGASGVEDGIAWPRMSIRGRHEENWPGVLPGPRSSDLTVRIRRIWGR